MQLLQLPAAWRRAAAQPQQRAVQPPQVLAVLPNAARGGTGAASESTKSCPLCMRTRELASSAKQG